jgi:hypothetical protein
MTLEKLVKVALEELRMQMLGAQVLFGFQLQSVFQENFNIATQTARGVDFLGLSMIVTTIALLLAAPAQHRIVDRGNASRRIFHIATRFAELALIPFALALGSGIYVVAEPYGGSRSSVICAGTVVMGALVLWYGLGWILRQSRTAQEIKPLPRETKTDCHIKIDEMLTEARVILPGAQALLGFQFVVTMTKAFGRLPALAQGIHFAALAAITLSVMLLLTPAAVHRMAFNGEDVPRFHHIGSFLVTTALLPLALGICADFYVATIKISNNASFALVAASAAFVMLGSLWYGLPLLLRRKYIAVVT